MRMAGSVGRWIAGFLLVLLGLVWATGSTSAFDRFERLLPALAASTGGMSHHEVFRYVGFGGEAPQAYFKPANLPFSSGVMALDKALADPQPSSELTGIRLDSVQAALVHGRPPADVIVILGPKGFAAGAPAALEKRGFEKAVAEGIAMHRLAEDFAVSLSRRNPVDPFGFGLGSAQRVVVLDDIVVAARGTLPATSSAAPFARPVSCVTCKTIGALAGPVRSAAGDRAHLRAASAYGARAFLAADDPAAVLIDKSGAPVDPAELERRLDARKAARARLPVFGVALLAHTVGEAGPALHIALSFMSKADAEQAVRAIAERVGAKAWGTTSGPVARGVQLPKVAAVATSVISVGPGIAGVLTVTHPGEPADAAAREFLLWHRMIANRDFWPLQILE